MTISRKNLNKPAPKWFLKTKKATTMLADATIIILLSSGWDENSYIILILRVGLSAVLNTLETFLADNE